MSIRRYCLAWFSLFLVIFTNAQKTDIFSSAGSGTWTVPSGVTSVTMEVWGGGGAGQKVGGVTTGYLASGGGGSGGGFVRATYTVVPGSVFTYTVAGGGTGNTGSDGQASNIKMGASTVLEAAGGKGAGAASNSLNQNFSGTGAVAPLAIANTIVGGSNLTSTKGGNGADASNVSGGGGSSAGNGNGNNAININGGIAPVNGFAGANGIPTRTQSIGNSGNIGAGGSGARSNQNNQSQNGGAGGLGQIKITYTCPIISAGPNQTLAACATTTTLAGTAVTVPATGVWTVVSGSGSITTSTSATSGVTGIVPGTPLVLRWTVTNGNCGTTSSDVTITSPLGSGCITYCTPTGNRDCTLSDFISNVTYNTLNNNSTCNAGGYTNFPKTGTQTTSVLKGSSYPFSLSVGAGTGTHGAAVWIDFNQNGSFSDAGEFFLVSNSITPNTTTNISIPIPIGAATGDVRMRVRYAFNINVVSGAGMSCTMAGTYGETEDYTISLVTPSPCATPGAQPTNLVLTTSGNTINGTFTAPSPAPDNYLVVRSSSSTPPSAPVNGTTYTIGSTLGAGYTIVDNDGNTSFSATGLTLNTTYYFYIYSFNSLCSGGPLYLGTNPLSGNIILPLIYCAATVSDATQSAETYIQKVRFLGTLNDVVNDQAVGSRFSTSAPFGYQDYTTLPNKTRQAMGNGINVYVESNSILNSSNVETNDASYVAWIDWNKDGDFDDPQEKIYDSKAQVLSTTFGIIIPTDPSIIPFGPGDYRLRIRINKRQASAASCANINNAGETEDYLIQVIANCSAVVTTVGKIEDQSRCGPGVVSLTAAASAGGVTGFRWYTAETGGTLVGTSSTTDGITTTWPTPSISTTTTYYVEAYNATCISLVRIPVVATVKLVPAVAFTPSVAESCGKDSVITLSAVGGNEVDYLINENFEAGGLGTFSNVRTGPDNGTTINSRSAWQSLSSVNFPVNYGTGSSQTWFPALSSGVNGNKFVMASSDIGQISANNPRIAENALVSPEKNALDYLNLTLSFKMYYSRYHPDGTLTTKDFIDVQVATNAAGDNWVTVPLGTIITDKGIGTRFEQLTFNLNSYAGQSILKVRILYHGEWCDGVAVDDIQLYGEKKLKPSFSWDPGVNPLNFYTDAGATTLYTQGTPIEAVYIRPTLDQMESASSWNVSATATLGNGCPVAGNITVTNSNKIWNSVSTDWSDSSKWKPNAVLPNSNTCVIVRSPLGLLNGDGLAKNISIEAAGSLTIKKDRTLTVTDYIKNESTLLPNNESNLLVETDGNLIQLNNGAANSGRMTAQRLINGLRYNPGSAVDYVYWSSPVGGQKTKNTTGNTDGFSSGTANTNFFTYRESNDRFYETGDPTFTLGKGYAVQAERNKGSLPFNRLFEFKGTPNNGDIGFPLAFTNAAHGFNLVGNPYPSNIDFNQLSLENKGLIYNTAWFWTNNVYTANQMGSGYTGNNYAVYNGSGGNRATYNPQSPYQGGLVPNGIIKVAQGFIVQAKSAGTLNFKNKYDDAHVLRVNTTGDFYSKNSTPKNRFLIQLLSPSQLSNSQLIAYVEGATDGFEQDYDAEAFDNYSDLFYSVILDKKLVIQGKSEAFNNEDKVVLGANFFQNGSYTIALENAEGIFNGSQNIYLKDKQEGIITNLSQGSYTFLATKADNATRFEIIYKPETVLATNDKTKDKLSIYREGNDFVVKSNNKKITEINLFDVSGKLIYSNRLNEMKAVIPAVQLINAVYVLKINQGGTITTKKIIK